MKSIIYFIGILFLVSCSDEISSINLDDETIVVSAYLFAGQAIDSIRLTKSIAYSGSGELESVDGLEVVINDGNVNVLLESIGDGYYRNLDYIVKENTSYSLSFAFGDAMISAETYVRGSVEMVLSRSEVQLDKIENTGTFPGPGGGPGGFGGQDQEVIDIFWDNSTLDYYFVDVENVEDDPEYVNEFFQNLENEVDLPERFFRTEPQILDAYSINSGRELRIYGTYLITIYRLNAEYAALYETVGSSTLSIQEPPSNINNGLGIFTGITPHYLYLEVVK